MRHLTRPPILTLRYWSAKRLSILIGFALTILGSLGSHFYVDPLQSLSAKFDQQTKDVAARIDTLKNAQAQYLLFREQSTLVFALNAANAAATDGPKNAQFSNLYQVSLLDRSIAVRTLIGELATARFIDYAPTRAQYSTLIDAARKDLSLETYAKVDDFERSTMDKANALMSVLQQAYLTAGQSKSETDRKVDQRQASLLALMALGSTFLLAANLISTRQEEAAGTAAGKADDKVGELTTAAQLIELALNQAKTGGGRPGAPGG